MPKCIEYQSALILKSEGRERRMNEPSSTWILESLSSSFEKDFEDYICTTYTWIWEFFKILSPIDDDDLILKGLIETQSLENGKYMNSIWVCVSGHAKLDCALVCV